MESINKQLYPKFELDRMKRYAFDAGICRLIAMEMGDCQLLAEQIETGVNY
jgi:hypothetical protein